MRAAIPKLTTLALFPYPSPRGQRSRFFCAAHFLFEREAAWRKVAKIRHDQACVLKVACRGDRAAPITYPKRSSHMRCLSIAAVTALVGLSACGDTLTEQSLAGGAVGAGAAAVLDGSLIKGAVVGAAGNVLYCQRYPAQC